MWRLPERRPERPDEMGLRNAGHPREGTDVERIRISAVDGIARPQHPPVQFLDRTGHGAQLKPRSWCPGTPIRPRGSNLDADIGTGL